MSITNYSPSMAGARYPLPLNTAKTNRPLHQLAAVRRREGLSRRAVARRMGSDVATIKQQEEQANDMLLSDLYRWQKALGVPVVELIAEAEGSLSPPVFKRAQMLRLMKTAAAIMEQSEHSSVRRMATMLIGQILEIMPELENVSPWNAVGQRRSLDELGQAAQRRLSLESLIDLID